MYATLHDHTTHVTTHVTTRVPHMYPTPPHRTLQSEAAADSEEFIENYDLGKKLGSGAFSVVRRAVAKSGGGKSSVAASPPPQPFRFR